MRKILLIAFGVVLLALLSRSASFGQLAFPATSHTGINWVRYYISGSLCVDCQGTNKDDSASYAPYSVSFRAGKWGLNKGTIINTPANRNAIITPLQGMVIYDTTSKRFYGRNDTGWVVLDGGGGGITDLSSFDTDDLAEGSTNLYYTTARWDTRLATKTTDNLTEGSTNLYFTNARARSAISVSGDLSYNSTTGVLSYTGPSLSGYVTQSQLDDTASAIRSDIPTYSTPTIDQVVTAGDVINNRNVTLDRVSGSKGFYLTDNGWNVSHWEVNPNGTQIHMIDGANEAIMTEDSITVTNTGTSLRSSLKPDKIIVGNKALTGGNPGTIAVTSDIPSLSGYATQSALDDTASDIRAVIAAVPALSDGDKGDITVSSSGSVWNIDAGTVGPTEINATGTPGSGNYLRGDGTWNNITGGTATFNGDGVTTTFNIAHGLGSTPSIFVVSLGSAGAATTGRTYYTADATNITATYVTGTPASGTGNVVFRWFAIK